MQITNEIKNRPIEGNLKISAEDFIVEEITNNNTVLEVDKSFSIMPYNQIQQQKDQKHDLKFCLFILQKKNWNTIQALTAIAKKLRKSFKSAGFAGTKDRTSISTQLSTIFGVEPDQLLNLRIKDIKINGAWIVSRKIELGDLLGNKFSIKITNTKINGSIEDAIKSFNNVFPNYFGKQRFGNRNNNHLVGIELLKGNFENAAIKFLTDVENESNEISRQARIKLYNERDFKKALDYFPRYLKYERLVLNYLASYPSDYANALRKLPRNLNLIFLHSVEAFIFNKELEEIIKNNSLIEDINFICVKNKFGFPDITQITKINKKELENNKNYFYAVNIMGYDSELNNLEKEILNNLELEQDMFKVKRMPELNCKGSFRILFSPFFNFNSKINKENKELDLKFLLPKSSYATVFLNELVNEKKV